MKEAFLKALPSSLKELLKNSPDSVAPLKELFAISQRTGYADQLDFTKLYKIADDVLKRSGPSRPGKRKTQDESVEVKIPTSAKRNKLASSSRHRSKRGNIRDTPKDSPRRHVRLKRPAARVGSDVKRSPTKLRKIPGMQNFARGRRSIVIDQITKKYKRIAEKKNRLS
ncbi:hypothetical protein COOONC_10041 [Cooperia oncophora]